MDLRKFNSLPDVFEAAISKLSNNFVVDLCIASRDAEAKAMLKEDRVEQCKQGRYYLEYMTDRARTYWEPPSPYYDGLVCHKHKGWFRPDADDNEPKMVRKWLTEYQFLHGRTQKEPRFVSEKFPHVSGNALRTQYLREKPGQLSCATCGHVYLWRSKPKLWELACWQIAAPYEAEHPYAQKCLNRRSRTFGKSLYYFNGKAVSCSLCTVVTCASCSQVFNWGDQFRREFCPCGGQVIATRRTGPQRPGPVLVSPAVVDLATELGLDVSALCPEYTVGQSMDPKLPGTVFLRQFERRCHCCGDLEILPGLEYLSYDDPGEDLRDYGWGRSWDSALRYLGGELQTEEYPHLHMKRWGTSQTLRFVPGQQYEIPTEFWCRMRACRGMYFPCSKCPSCRVGCGRALYCVTKTEPQATMASYPLKQELEHAVVLQRACFADASSPWPIDAPVWQLAPHNGCRFTSKWMGYAFFVCSCRGKPKGVPRDEIKPFYGVLCHKQIFYRCPYTADAADATYEEDHLAEAFAGMLSEAT